MLRRAIWLALAATTGRHGTMAAWSLLRLRPEAGGLGPPRWTAAAVVPAVAGAVFDCLENAAVTDPMRVGARAATDADIARTSRWKILKTTANTMAFSTLADVLVVRGVRRRRRG